MARSREKIGVFSFGRKQSHRCVNKMLRPFGNTTLTDIILKKLKILGEHSFFSGYEEEFAEKCSQHGVRFVERSIHSTLIDGPITEILSFLQDLEYEYFLIVNGCLPFLTVKTISCFLQKCLNKELDSAFAVIRRNNFYFGMDRTPLNFSLSLKTINTKTVDSVYEFAHALYFFNKDYFFYHGTYWDWKTVELLELEGKLQLFDIDTEEDFALTQSIWKEYEGDIYSL